METHPNKNITWFIHCLVRSNSSLYVVSVDWITCNVKQVNECSPWDQSGTELGPSGPSEWVQCQRTNNFCTYPHKAWTTRFVHCCMRSRACGESRDNYDYGSGHRNHHYLKSIEAMKKREAWLERHWGQDALHLCCNWQMYAVSQPGFYCADHTRSTYSSMLRRARAHRGLHWCSCPLSARFSNKNKWQIAQKIKSIYRAPMKPRIVAVFRSCWVSIRKRLSGTLYFAAGNDQVELVAEL